MKTVINITIPKSWQQLSDKQLRYVFRLLNGNFTLTQIKTLCLLQWGGIKVIRREAGLFIIKGIRGRFSDSFKTVYLHNSS